MSHTVDDHLGFEDLGPVRAMLTHVMLWGTEER
jgi:hypothetical protein